MKWFAKYEYVLVLCVADKFGDLLIELRVTSRNEPNPGAQLLTTLRVKSNLLFGGVTHCHLQITELVMEHFHRSNVRMEIVSYNFNWVKIIVRFGNHKIKF